MAVSMSMSVSPVAFEVARARGAPEESSRYVTAARVAVIALWQPDPGLLITSDASQLAAFVRADRTLRPPRPEGYPVA